MRTDDRMERIRMTEDVGETDALMDFAGWALDVLSGGRLDAYIHGLQKRAEQGKDVEKTRPLAGERSLGVGRQAI